MIRAEIQPPALGAVPTAAPPCAAGPAKPTDCCGIDQPALAGPDAWPEAQRRLICTLQGTPADTPPRATGCGTDR